MNKYQKALNVFKTYGGFCKSEYNYQHEHYSTAVHALQELVDIEPEYRELKDKKTPKKPIGYNYEHDYTYFSYVRHHCPSCENKVEVKNTYCPRCGQRLDWSEEND